MTIIKRILAAWPLVWRSTLEKERLFHKSDVDYFKKVHDTDQQEIKRLVLRNDELMSLIQKQRARYIEIKKQYESVLRGKVKEGEAEPMSLSIDAFTPGPLQVLQDDAKQTDESKKLAPNKIEQAMHLAQIQAGDNWQAQESKYQQVKGHYRNFKRQTASVVRKIKETPAPETLEQALGFFSAMEYAAEELESAGAYDPELTLDDITAIYGGIEYVPSYLLSPDMLQKQIELLRSDDESQ